MLLSLKLPFLKCVIQLFLLPCIPLNLLVLIRCFHENEIFKNYSNGLTHWRPIPIHYQDQSFLHCRPISIVYRDQFYIFFHFRTIPDTLSGLGFSVCYLLLSFHSKFFSGGVHSFYFTKPLRNPTQLDKLLLTISKMAEDYLTLPLFLVGHDVGYYGPPFFPVGSNFCASVYVHSCISGDVSQPSASFPSSTAFAIYHAFCDYTL